jgi:cyclopropane fatty-acyl-phospholipid synthase-like methyltransferase
MSDYFDQVASTWEQNPMINVRARITAEYLKLASLKVNKHLLDFGGGTGSLSVYLLDSFDQITIVDTSKEMLKVAQEKIKEAKITNIKTFKIKDNISEIVDKYSAIITLMTLHHISDIDKFFYSASKILDKHGALIIADLYQEDGSFHKHDHGFNGHNGFKIEELSKKLKYAGFEVSQVCEYFEIKKEINPGEEKVFPLFFLVAEKSDDQSS